MGIAIFAVIRSRRAKYNKDMDNENKDESLVNQMKKAK